MIDLYKIFQSNRHPGNKQLFHRGAFPQPQINWTAHRLPPGDRCPTSTTSRSPSRFTSRTPSRHCNDAKSSIRSRVRAVVESTLGKQVAFSEQGSKNIAAQSGSLNCMEICQYKQDIRILGSGSSQTAHEAIEAIRESIT